jgi:hypothetical protein
MGYRSDRKQLARRIQSLLERCRDSRRLITDDGVLKPGHRQLAGWQSARLAWTHRAFFEAARYRPAVTFFLSDLYGDRDYTPRDEGMERVYPLMVRMMPVRAMRSIALGIEMHALSQELDIALCGQLYADKPRTEDFTAAEYAAAYRACDNVPARREQIEMIGRIGRDLDHVVHLPLVYNTVLLSRKPAELAGLMALHQFIERGFRAFRHMQGADEFLEAIMRREFAVMDAVLADAPAADWAHPEADPAVAPTTSGKTRRRAAQSSA